MVQRRGLGRRRARHVLNFRAPSDRGPVRPPVRRPDKSARLAIEAPWGRSCDGRINPRAGGGRGPVGTAEPPAHSRVVDRRSLRPGARRTHVPTPCGRRYGHDGSSPAGSSPAGSGLARVQPARAQPARGWLESSRLEPSRLGAGPGPDTPKPHTIKVWGLVPSCGLGHSFQGFSMGSA